MDITIDYKGTAISVKDVAHDDVPALIEEIMVKIDSRTKEHFLATFDKGVLNSIYGTSLCPNEAIIMRGNANPSDLIWNSFLSAQKALNALNKEIQDRGFCTVSDVFALRGKPCPAPSTGLHYGWTDLKSAYISRSDEDTTGWVILFPKLLQKVN